MSTIKLKNILAENMRRFNTKNLNEQSENPKDLQNRLAILYLMQTKKLNNISAEKELYNLGGYDNFITGFDGQNESYMDWLESVGLKRDDVYINTSDIERVKMFLNSKQTM